VSVIQEEARVHTRRGVRRPMRVAWIGTPMDSGSVTYIATQFLERLPELGFEVDCFSPSVEDLVPERLRTKQGLRFFFQPLRYRSGRWYSRGKLSGYVVGQSERAAAQALLADRIRREHASHPYDCVYQISQLELFALRALRRALPPIVLHPHTHAAAELRWLRREHDLVAEAMSRPRERVGRAVVQMRAAVQRRDINLASLVIAPSARYADHLSLDYGFPRDRIAVVPNPIDLTRHAPLPSLAHRLDEPQRLLFISRIAVRKGVEMVVRLSHALGDLAGRVHIHVIGDQAAWGDYSSLLRNLHPATATYEGYVPPPVLATLYQRADAVIQPSRFEPFGLTISEGLATGIPVVASSEVGAIDGVDPSVCRVFPDGDDAAFAHQVRRLLAETAVPERRRKLSVTARSEAERLFAPDRSARALADALHRLPQLTPVGPPRLP
jgi:glycosyltransferase involved in cell wall biosynthesis